MPCYGLCYTYRRIETRIHSQIAYRWFDSQLLRCFLSLCTATQSLASSSSPFCSYTIHRCELSSTKFCTHQHYLLPTHWYSQHFTDPYPGNWVFAYSMSAIVPAIFQEIRLSLFVSHVLCLPQNLCNP